MPSRKRRLPDSPSKENHHKTHVAPNSSSTKKKDYSHPRGQSQSCHQCRQSIFSSKGVGEIKQGQKRIKCSSCTRYWCENCLRNRYGLERSILDGDSWLCPVCHKICNCSVCRRKNGKLATGILTAVVKNAGFSSVSDFLENGTDDIAKCLQWKQPQGKEEKPHDNTPSSTDLSQVHPTPPSKRPKRTPPSSTKDVVLNIKPESVVLNHPEYSITLDDKTDLVGVGHLSHDNQGGVCGRQLRSGRIVTYESLPKGCGHKRKARVKSLQVKELSSKKSSENKEVGTMGELEEELDNEEKKRLEELRMKAMTEIRDKKNEMKLEAQKDKKLKRAEFLEKRRKEKSLLIEEKRKEMEAALMKKRKLKEEKALEKKRLKAESKLALQEKLRRAKQLVLDAHKNRKAQAMKIMTTTRTTSVKKNELLILEGDSPAECDSKGVPTLPPLNLYRHEGVPDWCLAKMVFVSEFIYSFASTLNLSNTEKEGLLDCLLHNPHFIHKVYAGLLGIIAEDDEQLNMALVKKKGNRREIIKLVCDHLRQSGTQDSDVLNEYDRTPEQCIMILDQLCHLVLQCKSFGDLVENQIEKLVSERKELRLKKSEISKEMRQQLHATCSGGGSIEDIEQIKTTFENKLKELQSSYPNNNNEFSFRGQYMGTDRYNRVYWRLHSFPGKIMVESEEEQGGHSQGHQWSVIDSRELLDLFMNSLHKTGFRERILYQSLLSFKAKMI